MTNWPSRRREFRRALDDYCHYAEPPRGIVPQRSPAGAESGQQAGGASAARTGPPHCRRSNPAARHIGIPAREGADVDRRSAQAFAPVANFNVSPQLLPATNVADPACVGDGRDDGVERGGGIGPGQRRAGSDVRTKLPAVHGFSLVCVAASMFDDARGPVERAPPVRAVEG